MSSNRTVSVRRRTGTRAPSARRRAATRATTHDHRGTGSRHPERSHQATTRRRPQPPITRTNGPPPVRDPRDRRLGERRRDESRGSASETSDRSATSVPERQPDEAERGGGDAEQQRGRDGRERREVRDDRHARDLVEMEQQQRASRRAGRRSSFPPPSRRAAGMNRPQPLGDRRGERDHPGGRRDGQLEPDRVDEPRVEHQQHQHGRREDRCRPRAACRAARPISARHAIAPARSTDGSAPVSTTKSTTTPMPEREPRDAAEPERGGEREHRSEHHRDVLARHDQQMAEAGRLEVARRDGIELRRVAEDEPEQQPGLARREDPFDRATRRTRGRPGSAGRTGSAPGRGARASAPERTTASPR